MHTASRPALALLLCAAVATLGAGSAAAQAIQLEPDTDIPGADLQRIELPRPDANECRTRCAANPACKAFTYVKPGTPGSPRPTCYLKSAVGQRSRNNCCVSGEKRGAAASITMGANPAPGGAAPAAASGCGPIQPSHVEDFANDVQHYMHHQCRDRQYWGRPDQAAECGWQKIQNEKRDKFQRRNFPQGSAQWNCLRQAVLAHKKVRDKMQELVANDIPQMRTDTGSAWASCVAEVTAFESQLRDYIHHRCKGRRAEPLTFDCAWQELLREKRRDLDSRGISAGSPKEGCLKVGLQNHPRVVAKLAEHVRYWREGNLLAGLEQAKDKVAKPFEEMVAAAGAVLQQAGRAIESGIKNVWEQLKNAAMNFIRDKLNDVFGQIRSVIGIDLTVIRDAYDPATKKVDKQRVRNHIVEKLKEFALDKLKDLVRWGLDKAWDAVRRPIEGAISGALAGIGSIPFVGGVLSSLVSMAVTEGTSALRNFAADKLTEAVTPLVGDLFQKGIDWLVNQFAPVRTVLNWAMSQIAVVENMLASR
jgi:hypothetical protein